MTDEHQSQKKRLSEGFLGLDYWTESKKSSRRKRKRRMRRRRRRGREPSHGQKESKRMS